jgi:citrate lyase subunit beta / citryl-CoA lyase
MRSLLFVPADNEHKMEKAWATAADAVIFDLEDAVLPDRKVLARTTLGGFLSARPLSERHWIRVNGPESSDLLLDIAAVAPWRPTGIVLPKIRGPEDVTAVDHYLTMAEAIHGVEGGSIKIMAVCTETPLAVLRMADIATIQCSRLAGFIWGGEDLSSALGAKDPRTTDRRWRPVYEHARTQSLLAAHALGVMAIDTVYVDIRDADGCRQSAVAAREDGFSGKIAIHPAQVEIINAAFTPLPAEVDEARRIIAAFDGGAGTVNFEGRMIDIPHLKAARRLIVNAEMNGALDRPT